MVGNDPTVVDAECALSLEDLLAASSGSSGSASEEALPVRIRKYNRLKTEDKLGFLRKTVWKISSKIQPSSNIKDERRNSGRTLIQKDLVFQGICAYTRI